MPIRGKNEIIKCMDNTSFGCVQKIVVFCEYKCIYLLMTLSLDCVPSNGWMSDGLKKIWNKMVVTQLTCYPSIFLMVPRKTMNNWSE
jgi:hypothetical protein